MTDACSILARRTLAGFVILSALANGALAQEICGLANVQYNRLSADGFESSNPLLLGAFSEAEWLPTNTKEGRRSRGIDPGKAVSMAPVIPKGVAPTLTITAPASGANIPTRSFLVRGTFTGPVNTGITVSGSPALVFGNQWASLPVRASAGAFEISATATTFDALTVSVTRSVTVGSAVLEVALLPKQPAQMAPATMGYVLRGGSAALGNVQVDFDGDGNDEYVGLIGALPKTFAYSAPGLYSVRLNALTANGPVLSEHPVLIVDVQTQRQRACAVYGALRTALAANDLEASLATLIDYKREAQRPFFTALGSNRPVFAARLGIIANGVIGVDQATLVALRMESGQPIGYPLTIAADAQGVWRIVAF